MSTSFSKKCEILGEVHSESQFNEVLNDFKNYHDIGLPLAYVLSMDLVTLKEENSEGKEFIEETWNNFCIGLELDPEKEYQDLDEMVELSPVIDEEDLNPEVEDEA